MKRALALTLFLFGCGTEQIPRYLERACNQDFWYQADVGVYVEGVKFRAVNIRSIESESGGRQVFIAGDFRAIYDVGCVVNVQEMKVDHAIADSYSGYSAY